VLLAPSPSLLANPRASTHRSVESEWQFGPTSAHSTSRVRDTGAVLAVLRLPRCLDLHGSGVPT
jgi:hypothetical protein